VRSRLEIALGATAFTLVLQAEIGDPCRAVHDQAGAGPLSQRHAFATTRWSLILSAADTGSDDKKKVNEALAELCRTYWEPVFLVVSRRGYPIQEAQDLTQDFFLMILETNWLKHADEHRGKFRSFLLKSVQNFLGHARERSHAQKRGGKLEFISLERTTQPASRLCVAPETLETLPPERLFDLRWAATVVDKALGRLREECESHGRLRLFETLSSHLAAERGDVSYARLAADLGIDEAMVKKQLHNLRQRYRWLLRDEVAHTVERAADVDDEIRYLCAVLAAAAER